ncbi:MAG: CRISPR-associated endonuclease Cas2 [Nitrososphaerota archaeon]|jgi:CRISPR-associated protein Cas2|nr:CRISPR-associated endonuclease Cas2 [Nitrososphaerota archaeon]
MRNKYLVAYDIADDERLRIIHRRLLGFGEPIQYSIFMCDLSPSELITLKCRIVDIINTKEDSLLIANLGSSKKSGNMRIEYIGKPIELASSGLYVF